MIRSRAKLGLSSVVVMEAARQEAGGGDEKICRRNDGKIYCKNVNGDNKLQYCDKHYKDFTDFYTENPSLLISSNKIRFLPKEKMEEIEFLMKNKLPLPDEHLCRHNNGTWRCKNLRMAHSVPKTKYCERHYNYYKNLRKKKTSRDGDGASGIKTRDPNFSKMRNKVMEEHDRSLDVTGIQPAANSSTKNPSSMTSKKRKYLKKNKEEMEMKLLPDEHFCSHTSGIYRCGNFSMSHGAAAEDPSVPKSRFCEKHYNYYSNYYNNLKKKKKLFKNTSRDGEGAGTGIGPIEPRDSNCSKSRKKIMEEHDRSLDPFVHLVSDEDSVEILGESEDSDSECSLGALMDMLAMKYRNTNEDKEIKWKFEADMVSSFEEEPELCMKAVCSLYRQQICEDKGLLHNSDALRCTTLAKFLMDEDCEGDLNKSVKELEIFDSTAVEDCKRLARRYSTQLFSIYQNGKDPFFLPATTGAIHGDETAK
ncbi:hypothetical protein C5167_030176 [Papaver somniferum]|nr:hypothetical protein C5167_030176 [Papaver somniferum]